MSSTNPSQTGFIDVGDARLYYDEKGTGQPLVLIHAGIADSRMWDPQVKLLAAKCRVLRFDLRGFGQTVVGSGAFADWQDVETIFTALNIGPAVIVGASMGARIAVEFALQRRDLVSGLMLVAPGLFWNTPRSEALRTGWKAMETALEAGDPDRALEIELGLWVDGPRRNPGEVDAEVRNRVNEMNKRVFELLEATSGRKDMSPPAVERLGEVNAPTFVVVGSMDQSDILDIADRLTDTIDGARKIVVDGAAHMVSMELPELYNALVIEFLDGIQT